MFDSGKMAGLPLEQSSGLEWPYAPGRSGRLSVTLSVDLELFYHALFPPEDWHYYESKKDVMTVYHLLKVLERHHVTAMFYVLGDVAQRERSLIEWIAAQGHSLGSHGYLHRHGEQEGDLSDQMTRDLLPHCRGYRPPFWEGVRRPGYAGGAFFRLLPYPLLKLEVLRSRHLYLHPYDLDLHPSMLRRSFCVGEPWAKFERLLDECW